MSKYIEAGIRTRINKEGATLAMHIEKMQAVEWRSPRWERQYVKFKSTEDRIKGLEIALEIVEERS